MRVHIRVEKYTFSRIYISEKGIQNGLLVAVEESHQSPPRDHIEAVDEVSDT
jgi:hypothetical protein